MPVQPFLRRLVVVRHDRQARGSRRRLFAYLVSSIASAVELAPVPAITGMRPAACSTAVRISWQCSSTLTVGDSPVVPTMTIAAVPLADMEVDQVRECGEVERAVGLHRRHDGDETSGDSMLLRRRKRAILPDSPSAARTAAGAVPRVRTGSAQFEDSRRQARHLARPGPIAAMRCTTAWPYRTASQPLLERDDAQPARGRRRATRRAQQERGIGGSAERFVAPRRTSRRAARHRRPARRARCGEQRPMQVVRHDDRVERFARQAAMPRLEVGDARRRRRATARERRQRVGVAVDGDHVRATRREKPRLPPAPRSDVEHARTARAPGARSARPMRDGRTSW